MKVTRISNGRVIDPSQNLDQVTDLWIVGERIQALGPQPQLRADETHDATGLIVCPGLIDMHVHLREPGHEEDETIATGTAAALAGGVTSVACMPDTEPALDSQAGAEFVYLQAQRAGRARVYPIGAITKGREGSELAELGGLVEGDAVAFTDHDRPLVSAEIMRRALEYCRMFDKPVLCHAEDPELTRGGVMNEGFQSTLLGMRGIPNAAEAIIIHRDLELAELTGGKLHILLVSTAGGVDLIRRAKQRGVQVTCEVAVHHLAMTDERLSSFDSSYKMAPPLRTREDVAALLAGLRDDTIDAIVSDHAPYAPEKKMRELDLTPFGIIGLETLLPICVRTLLEPGHLTWPQLLAKLTVNPARILGIEGGTLRPGTVADVALIDPTTPWTIDSAAFRAKSRNCPFQGWQVRGRAQKVFVGGEVK